MHSIGFPAEHQDYSPFLYAMSSTQASKDRNVDAMQNPHTEIVIESFLSQNFLERLKNFNVPPEINNLAMGEHDIRMDCFNVLAIRASPFWQTTH